jgi:hypothetical protein
MIIIIVLKPDSWVNSGPKHGARGQFDHWFGPDLGLNNDKNNYYHNLKTWLGGRLEAKALVRLTIDLCQSKDKIDYYHNFKIQFDGRSRARFESQIGLTIDLS